MSRLAELYQTAGGLGADKRIIGGDPNSGRVFYEDPKTGQVLSYRPSTQNLEGYQIDKHADSADQFDESAVESMVTIPERQEPRQATRKRARRPRPNRTAKRLESLMAKAQGGFKTAPAGGTVAAANLPEDVRGKMNSVYGGEIAGWSLEDLDKRDMMTLRQLMGKNNWSQWNRSQRAATGDDSWTPWVGRE